MDSPAASPREAATVGSHGHAPYLPPVRWATKRSSISRTPARLSLAHAKLALASGAASKRQLRVVRMSGPGGTHAANLAATGRQHSWHHTTNSSIGRQSDGLFFQTMVDFVKSCTHDPIRYAHRPVRIHTKSHGALCWRCQGVDLPARRGQRPSPARVSAHRSGGAAWGWGTSHASLLFPGRLRPCTPNAYAAGAASR